MLCNVATVANASEIQVRTVGVDPINMSSRYEDGFETCDISYDTDVVSLVATNEFTAADSIMFDNVSMTEDADSGTEEVKLTDEEIEAEFNEDELLDTNQLKEDIPEATNDSEESCDSEDMDDYEDAEVSYECSLDMNDLVFEFNAELVAEDGTVLDTEEITTDAIITENGGLDACIVIDGQEYMMSDYENTSSIDDCSIASVIDIIKAYLAVAETAEKVKAKSNYSYNRELERNGEGMSKKTYVYSQTNTTSPGLKAGNYRFGFTTFDNVGCEVASAYNLARSARVTERLSQTIYYFEAWAIEFAIGWGNLGSNPFEIYRYLSRRGYSYSEYTDYASFKSAVGSKSSCYIIMSRWNSNISSGLHTFFVKKTSASTYYGYNWKYRSDTVKRSIAQSSISKFNDGSGFIVGYIVWE